MHIENASRSPPAPRLSTAVGSDDLNGPCSVDVVASRCQTNGTYTGRRQGHDEGETRERGRETERETARERTRETKGRHSWAAWKQVVCFYTGDFLCRIGCWRDRSFLGAIRSR